MSTRQLSVISQPSRTLTVAEYDPSANALSSQQVLGQLAVIQQVMAAAMKDGEHYGCIPGCGDKPTLLKPGAEKLCLTFHLAPTYEIDERQFDAGHREYRVQTSLASKITGTFLGQGVGTCSTMEAKYRYRGGGRKCPNCNKPTIIKGKAEFGGGWLCFAKKGGCGAKFKNGDKAIEGQSEERQENPDLADAYNTVLKMAKKRALVDAVLTATAASDIFTQDLEDISLAMEHNAAITQREDRREREARQAGDEPAAFDPNEVDQPARDFRQTRIHFGKNRGLELCELTSQQIHWYETDWMPKKEGQSASVEDLMLINALKAYRQWRTAEKATAAADPEKPAPPLDYAADAPDPDPEFSRG